MIALAGNSVLLMVWITFSTLVLVGVTAVLIWAVRSGQFSNQDQARRLPLESGIPLERPAPASTVPPAAPVPPAAHSASAAGPPSAGPLSAAPVEERRPPGC